MFLFIFLYNNIEINNVLVLEHFMVFVKVILKKKMKFQYNMKSQYSSELI